MPFYGVWVGKKTGVFTDWNDCSEQVKGFKGAKYKKLKATSMAEAEKEFSQGYTENKKEAVSEKSNNKKPQGRKKDLHKQAGVVIFCDGACPKNPGKSASGVSVFKDGKLIALKTGKYHEEGSNNVSELEGLLYCLETMSKRKSTAIIYADSAYAINVVTKWSFGWSKNGWRKSDGGIVENKDLVIKCFQAYQKVQEQVQIEKVKAHIGELGNELADRMAIHAVKNKIKDWEEYTNKDIEAILKIAY